MAGRRRKAVRIAREKGHFIKEWRRHRGLTQEQLAERIDTSASAISQLETGKQSYTQRILEDIALALNTEPASLLAEDPARQDEIWQLLEKIRRLPPATRRQAIAILETFAMTGTNQ